MSVRRRYAPTVDLRAVAVTGASATLLTVASGGCGGGAPSHEQGTQPPARLPVSPPATAVPVSPASGPYRFVGRPIVVRWTARGNTPPAYEIYFRLNRALTRRRLAVTVSLEGLDGSSEPNGLGYEDSAAPHCYAKGIDDVIDLPASLRRSRPGQRVTVNLDILAPRRGALGARVALLPRRADDTAPGDSSADWFHRLVSRYT